jgi:uncharacterized protein YdeI (BOF family)
MKKLIKKLEKLMKKSSPISPYNEGIRKGLLMAIEVAEEMKPALTIKGMVKMLQEIEEQNGDDLYVQIFNDGSGSIRVAIDDIIYISFSSVKGLQKELDVDKTS